jgi:retinol dehydrogenase-12
MKGKIVIITGSSSGIGKVNARHLLEDGAEVIFACRNRGKTLKVIEKICRKNNEMINRAHFMELNLSSFKSVIKFSNEFKSKFKTLDILVNNAGAYPPKDLVLSDDQIEIMFQSNHLSPMVLTLSLLECFKSDNGRIINVSSFAHIQSDYSLKKIEEMRNDLNFKAVEQQYFKNLWIQHYYYANSKLGNIYFSNYLSEILEKKYPHVKTVSLSPGLVYTEFARFFYDHNFFGKIYRFLWPSYKLIARNVVSGTQTSLHTCYLPHEDLLNGAYYNDCKIAKVSNLAEDKVIRNEFIKFSLEIINKQEGLSNIQF